MIEKFTNGNISDWTKLYTTIIPQINNSINKELLPSVENVLHSMLTATAVFSYKEANFTQIVENKKLSEVEFSFIFEVEDFKVEDAPQEAISTDEHAILDALTQFNVKSVAIDVKDGSLRINCKYPLV